MVRRLGFRIWVWDRSLNPPRWYREDRPRTNMKVLRRRIDYGPLSLAEKLPGWQNEEDSNHE